MAGLSVFSLASLLCGAATNLWLLVSARALQGIGAAFLMTLAMALTRQTATKARLGRAMGLLGTVSALGTALGPSLGGLLIALLGWRYIFWMQFPPAVIAFILASVTLPNDPDKGSGLSASLWSVLDQRLARHLVVNGLIAAIMMMTLVIGPFYLGLGLGLTAMQVGFVMAIGPMISIVSGVPSGRLVDAWGAGRVLDLGLTLLLIGAFLFAFLPNAIGVAGYVLSIIVLAPGYQLFQAANSTAALEDIPSNRQGAVSGLLTLSRNIGLIVGTSAMGTVFALSVGTQELAHASTLAIASGMRVTFLVASAMLVAAISISRGPRRA